MINQAELTPDQHQQINAELEHGEKVVWIGQPNPARFARSGLFVFLFGIPWTAFAVFWIGMAVWITHGGAHKTNGPALFGILFPLFGIPFVMIGIWMLTTPARMKRDAKKTVYVITNRRAIIFGGNLGFGPFGRRRGELEIRSFKPNRLRNLARTQSSDGSDDILFSPDTVNQRRGGSPYPQAGFFGIQNVKEVESLIKALADHGGANDEPPIMESRE